MDGDVLDDAAGRGDGETTARAMLCGVVPCHGALVTSWVWHRRHERGAEALLHHGSCVAVVMRGTGGRRAGGGRVGANGARSGGPRLGTRAVYCASSRAVGADRGPTPTWRR